MTTTVLNKEQLSALILAGRVQIGDDAIMLEGASWAHYNTVFELLRGTLGPIAVVVTDEMISKMKSGRNVYVDGSIVLHYVKK